MSDCFDECTAFIRGPFDPFDDEELEALAVELAKRSHISFGVARAALRGALDAYTRPPWLADLEADLAERCAQLTIAKGTEPTDG